MNCLRYLFLLFFIAAAVLSYAQQDSLPANPKPELSDLINQIDFYGSLRARLTAYDHNVEVQNNGTRFGVALQSLWNKEKKFALTGRMEWAVNIVSNDFEFNLEANNESGFAQAQKVQTQDPFKIRLGYIGLDFNQYGKITLGKQWGPYYEVAKMTDRFFVFGGSSLGTFANGTDGGALGTGRAEKALQYRLGLKNWKIAAQVQYRGVTGNSTQGDGYALSVLYQPDNVNLKVGAAFNTARIAKATADLIAGFSTEPSSFVAALSYWEGTTSPSHQSKLYVSLGYALLSSSEGVDTDSLTVVYDAHGLEGVFHYQFYKKLSVIAGFNLQFPTDLHGLIHEDFMKEQYILGLFYGLNSNGFVYLEGLINQGVNQFGAKAGNVITAGLRLNFSMAKERQKLLEYFY